MIYLDHNATTALDERVLAAMQPFFTLFHGNPSSLYRAGRIARSAIDGAREQVAALVDAAPNQIIFTSGGTEANNLALQAAALGSRLLVSQIEHPSISEPVRRLQRRGSTVKWLGVDRQGLFDSAALESVDLRSIAFASLMLANNETGVIQDISHWTSRLQEHNIQVHTDAVQALGKIPLSFKDLGVQLMSLSGHKIYGPKGSGALVIEKGLDIEPLQLGGGQEFNLRPGTENVAAIVGFGKAAELALTEFKTRNDRLLQLRQQLEQALKELSGVVLFSERAERLPNTVQFGIAGKDGEMLQMQLDQKNIAVSSGSACASGGGEPSPVLTAMGVTEDLAKSAIRVSLGQSNSPEDIIEFINVLKTVCPQ
ncbi:MAG: cysteine desulfurase [Gammaproteobacteria bacterium HGW-Gammaproteobacteria-3]|nr:MAG: cysteine desulfurase [Gammaproteobacteria bacterium HGW-Gammaproteobacteria-3]